jgi:pyruvate dehydrogenase E2 component (dihydrolipoamide acetyltransferase)
MDRFEFKLPDIGEGVTEGEIVSWLIVPGQAIAEDDPMVEVMTDKATVTITAPKSGRIVETRGAVGEVVKVHSVLVVFDIESSSRSSASASSTSSASPAPRDSGHVHENGVARGKEPPAATAVGDIRESLPGMQEVVRSGERATPGRAPFWNEKPLATPATRKLARDLELDLRAIPPTGPFGRITSDDVRAATVAGSRRAPASDATNATIVSAAERRARSGPAPLSPEQGREERVPLKGLRKRIFENMTRSKHTAAHFTFVEECDVTALKALREKLKPAALAQGKRLTFLPFIVKAAVIALRRHPSLNASFDETTQEIVTRRYYNIGVATATDAGLVVPVVKNAGDRSLLQLSGDIERLAEDARNNVLTRDDLTGSTFTVTSLGQKGGLLATPIIRFPEVAILGVHQIKRKPVVRGDEIVIGDVMMLSLSFDHRLIDGHVGAAFAYEIIGLLEQPETMFLDMV